MDTPKIFLALPKSTGESIERYCTDCIAPSWRKQILMINLTPTGVRNIDRSQLTEQTASIFESYNPNQSSSLLVHAEAKIDHLSLQERWIEHAFSPERFHKVSDKTIRKKIKKLSSAEQAFWTEYATAQLSSFEGRITRPEVWMEQFNRLGISHIGKRLLMQIRSIRFDNDKRPFGAKQHEELGQNVLYSYFSDEDQGGSWASVKEALHHNHRPESVDCVNWNPETGELGFPSQECDELVVCEDGLWSGKETIKRLNAMSALPPGPRVRLKFVVATDFGLLAVRHKIRELGLTGRVQVDAHDAEIISFLSRDLPSEVARGSGVSTTEYFRSLHDYVVPLAFSEESAWPEGCEEALQICRSVGSQLVEQWYAELQPKKDPLVAAEKFALGGGGFASTVFFNKSVPKVCLPMLWMDGTVEIEGRSVEWLPLLVNSRRVRNYKLLIDEN